MTGVDNREKLETLRSIEADHAIDFTEEDFNKNGETYDVIFDVVGKSSFSASEGSLKENGCYLSANPLMLQRFRRPGASKKGGKRAIFEMTNQKAEDLTFLKELIEAGEIKTLVDRSYPLEQIPEAHRYSETGQKKGNIVITGGRDTQP